MQPIYDNLELLMQMKRAVNDHQTIAIVPEPRIDDLLEEIDKDEHKSISKSRVQQWVIAASVLVLAVTAGALISARVDRQSEPQFRTVTSSGEAAQVGYVMNLTFSTDSMEAERMQLVSDLGASVLMDLDNGSIQIIVPMPAVSVAELEAFTNDLLRRPAIQAVDVVALQLPVRSDE